MPSTTFLLCVVAVWIAAECSEIEKQDKVEQVKLLSPLSGCPPGMTQCGSGCCPLSSAVCCSDGVHCCPSGYRCDYSVGGCVKNMLFSRFMDKKMPQGNTEPAQLLSPLSGCPPGMTQCGNGCCPLSSAECCSDGAHCCPSGYRCDYSVGGCVRNMLFSPFMDKKMPLENADSAKLLSSLSGCPPGMTQCGSGCCPLSSAVCCSDGVHCCPSGYRCDYSVGGCVRNMLFSPFLEKEKYLELPQVETQ